MKKKIKYVLPSFFKKIDFFLLINHPDIWATRIHYLIFYGGCLNLLVIIWAFLLPISLKWISDYLPTIYFLSIISAMGILAWTYSLRLFDPRTYYAKNLRFFEYKRVLLIFIGVTIFVMPFLTFLSIYNIRLASISPIGDNNLSIMADYREKIGQIKYDNDNFYYGNDSLEKIEDSVAAENYKKNIRYKFWMDAVEIHKIFGVPGTVLIPDTIEKWHAQMMKGETVNKILVDKLYSNLTKIQGGLLFKENLLLNCLTTILITLFIAYAISIYTTIHNYFEVKNLFFGILIHSFLLCLLMILYTSIKKVIVGDYMESTDYYSTYKAADFFCSLGILILTGFFSLKIYNWLKNVSVQRQHYILFWQILVFLIPVFLTFIFIEIGVLEDSLFSKENSKIANVIFGFYTLIAGIIYFAVLPPLKNMIYRIYSLPKEI